MVLEGLGPVLGRILCLSWLDCRWSSMLDGLVRNGLLKVAGAQPEMPGREARQRYLYTERRSRNEVPGGPSHPIAVGSCTL